MRLRPARDRWEMQCRLSRHLMCNRRSSESADESLLMLLADGFDNHSGSMTCENINLCYLLCYH